ncbi:NADPH-dependent FMN reductase [Brachybacterium sp. DNPG3]
MTKIGIITASARPNAVSTHVADWVASAVGERFEVDRIDLAQVALPAYDEAFPPRSGNAKTTEHGIAWSERVEALDAVVIVTPEYNYSYPGILKNAVDYLITEWTELPTVLVGTSWGGGARVLEKLEELMKAVDADVIGTVGLAFGQDVSPEGVLSVADEKAAQLVSALDRVESLVGSSVA